MGMGRNGMGLSLPVWLGLWGVGLAWVGSVGPSSAQSLPKPKLAGESAIVDLSEAPALVGLPPVAVKGAIGPVPLGAAIVAPQVVQPIGPVLGLAQVPQVTVPDLPPLYGLPGATIAPQSAPSSQPVSIPQPVQIPQSAPVSQPVLIPQPVQSAPIAQPVSPTAPIETKPAIEPVPSIEVNQTPAVTVLDFGQPLPGVQPAAMPTALVQPAFVQPTAVQPAFVQSGGSQQTATGVAQSPIVVPTSGGLLPKGTMLPLRYMGAQALQLKAGDPQPEVLILNAPIVDPSGRVILPLGTQVVGRFETDRQGSRFVVQAVAQGNQSQLILAASGPIGQKQSSKLALGSGIGAAAGLILGGKVGLLGGAAVGAATSYFTPPKPVTIAPNQVVMVRLEEDWR
jgi:hypothetical protein